MTVKPSDFNSCYQSKRIQGNMLPPPLPSRETFQNHDYGFQVEKKIKFAEHDIPLKEFHKSNVCEDLSPDILTSV